MSLIKQASQILRNLSTDIRRYSPSKEKIRIASRLLFSNTQTMFVETMYNYTDFSRKNSEHIKLLSGLNFKNLISGLGHQFHLSNMEIDDVVQDILLKFIADP